MKIISQTNNEIIIEKTSSKGSFKDNLYFFLFIFFIFPFVPLGVFFVTIFQGAALTGVARVNCDRVEPQQVDCQVSKSKFFDLLQGETINMKFVQSAKYNVIEREDSEGKKSYKYNFQIANKFGEIKTFESSKDTADKTAQTINSFLASKQTYLKHSADDRSNLGFVVGLAFALLLNLFIIFLCFNLWLFIVRTCSEKSIILNKSRLSFSYIENRFILGKKISDSKFFDISKVDILYSSDSYDNISYTPRILMKSGVKHYLDRVSDRQVAIKIANDLNRFMGLPEEEDPVVKE